MKRVLTFLILSILATVASAADTTLITGVCTHFVQRKGILDETIELIRATGVQSIRDEVPWAAVEKTRGVYEFPQRVDDYITAANKAGLQVLIPLGYANPLYEDGKKPTTPAGIKAYADYCRFIVTHLRGRVKWYEVWNEYNIGIGVKGNEPGTPENYMAMIEVASKAIREADPDAIIIGGVVAPQALKPGGYFEKICALGLMKNCDVVSVHTYNYAQPKSTRTPEAWLEAMKRIEQTVRQSPGGEKTPIWVTEHGWPTHVGTGGSALQLSADYLARAFLLARTLPSIQGLWWYDFQDDGWNLNYNEDCFGLVRADLTPKPAYAALQQIAPLVSTARFEGEVKTDDDAVRMLRFVAPDGKQIIAAWSTLDQPQGVQVVLTSPAEAKLDAVRLTVVGRPTINRAMVHRDWPANPRDAVLQTDQLSVLLTGTPVLIESGTASLQLHSVVRRAVKPATQPTTQPDATP